MKANLSPKINCNQRNIQKHEMHAVYSTALLKFHSSLHPVYSCFIHFSRVLFSFCLVSFNFWLAHLLRQSHVRRSKQNNLQQLGIGAMSVYGRVSLSFVVCHTNDTEHLKTFLPVRFENVRHANIC